MDIRSALVFAALIGVACGSSTAPAAATSPTAAATSDAVTQTYVAIVRSYWSGILTADKASGNTNEAARACLGTLTNSAPPNASLVEPATCHAHAVGLLAVHQKFLSDLHGTIAPPQFANDDRVFRSDVPRAIAAIQTLISVSATNNKQAIFDATNVYINVMYSSVLSAMDDVDPSTRHG